MLSNDSEIVSCLTANASFVWSAFLVNLWDALDDLCRIMTLTVVGKQHKSPKTKRKVYPRHICKLITKKSSMETTQQEAQLMLTTGSTHLLAVSRARAISDGTLT